MLIGCVSSRLATTSLKITKENAALEIIRKRLGHKSIHTTMRYAHLADDQLRIAADTVSDKLGSAMGF